MWTLPADTWNMGDYFEDLHDAKKGGTLVLVGHLTTAIIASQHLSERSLEKSFFIFFVNNKDSEKMAKNV